MTKKTPRKASVNQKEPENLVEDIDKAEKKTAKKVKKEKAEKKEVPAVHKSANQDKEIDSIARDTMTGDVRDIIIDIFKHTHDVKPWQQMTEAEQKSLANHVQTRVEAVVKRAVNLIARNGRKAITVAVEGVAVKDDAKCTIKIQKHDQMLMDVIASVGDTALLVVSSEQDFVGHKAPVETDPDEPELPIADACKNMPEKTKEDEKLAEAEKEAKEVPADEDAAALDKAFEADKVEDAA